ncbi:hypothetical protein GCM10011506_22700 [Marivirga lumbricoides]|uniref:Uncharacterized protein n=1 Tax=Marivirga lumbricoides TaxID=1046115 RepID=A0ABQ1M979_9BACT|nr:hypothetical protein GCM10011506_22700 [Marivirga lumbricoides]
MSIKFSAISVSFPKKTESARLTNRGIVKIMAKLLNEVMETDKATLPFNICVIRFEAVPPGTEAMSMTPTL